jgi:hypothetical protein
MTTPRTPRIVKNKPLVPENTCPYIDMVIEIIDKMEEQDNAEWRSEQATLAKSLLEYVRVSNDKLRISGKFWYERCKRTGDV